MTTESPPPEQSAALVQPLVEYVDSADVQMRVDAGAGLLRGVKLLGLNSKNGRRYLPSALRTAATLYEDAKVNVNHPAGGLHAPRDYRDRLGVIRGVEFREGHGLFGDFHFNPKHDLAGQLAWDAEHNPRNVGFSHNVLARLRREGEQTVVEQITRVQSVDLVADPATTQGLFEAQATDADEQALPGTNQSDGPRWDALTLESLELHRPDLLIESQRVAEQRRPRSAEQRTVLASVAPVPENAQQFARALKRR